MAEALIHTFKEAFGAGLICGLFAMGMYGLTTAQTYYYFVEYPKDRPWAKILVWALWILNTVHSALLIHLIYHYLIANAFNIFQLTQNIWSLPVSMLVHLITVFIVMVYFLSIIFRASAKNLRWWLVVPNLCAVLVHMGFGFTSAVQILHAHNVLDIPVFTRGTFLPSGITQACADVLLASSLCFVLYDHRTDFNSTNSIINTLIVYAVNRCLLTTGVALCSVLLIALNPNGFLYVGPELLWPGLYTNALMASLNSRSRIRDANDDDNFKSIHFQVSNHVRSDATPTSSHGES
ncbi:hypothetical protein C8R46DRAFT_382943 [Mycena filopes]|nr:hypothetical protein C8R46DRAFT_382943 [Mycena filopes]